MGGITKGKKLQYGLEGTKGTAVPATAIWGGPVSAAEDTSEYVFVPEDVGYITGRDRVYSPKTGAAYEMPATEFTFEQGPVVFSAGIKDVVSGSADGNTGTSKIYTYTMHYLATSLNSFKTYTLETGDNQQEEEMEYSFVSDFTLEGEAGQAWMLSANWIGRQVTPSTFTGALTPPATLEEALFSKTKLYIDEPGGTIGTTLKSQTLLKASLKWKTGLVPAFTGDGNLYFAFAKFVEPEITLEITFEHDATAVAEKAKWRSKTARLIRLICEGSAVATPGTTYTYKTLKIDLAGKWEKFDVLDDDGNGDVIVAGTFRVLRNDTASKFAEIVVVNELNTIAS